MAKQTLFITFLLLGLTIGPAMAQVELNSSHFLGFNHQRERVSNNFLYELEPVFGHYYGAGFHLLVDRSRITLGAGITQVNAKLEAVQLPSTSGLMNPIQISAQNSYLSFPVGISSAWVHGSNVSPRYGPCGRYRRKQRFHFALSYVPSFLLESQSIIRQENTIATMGEVTQGLFPFIQHTLTFSTIYLAHPTQGTHLAIAPYIGLQNNYFHQNNTSLVDGYLLGVRLSVLFTNLLKLNVAIDRSGMSEDQQKRLEEKQRQIQNHLEKR